jgi:hypothetical protein
MNGIESSLTGRARDRGLAVEVGRFWEEMSAIEERNRA